MQAAAVKHDDLRLVWRDEFDGDRLVFSSGRIRSRRCGDWNYGRFEIHRKLPAGLGLWPAIWMMPSDDVYGGWAPSGEIDIVVYKGQEPHQVQGTLHFRESWPKNRASGAQYRLIQGSFAEDFHVAAPEWEEGET